MNTSTNKTRKTVQSQSSEPMIVVDESSIEDAGESSDNTSGNESSGEESPTNAMNPYLLCPWRDPRETRKHSLPTPQCSGITASQVRRLSERGEGTTGPGPKQTQFLATLSSAAPPASNGRRHSVVTISKVPMNLFGKIRRESVADFPVQGRVLSSRRDSVVGPPSTEPRGSVHNLQLDIMDDIVQARKVRMKLWNTSSEKVCEVQPLDEAGGVQKYTSSGGRRYSDFIGTTLAPIPSSSRRRASELPPPIPPRASTSKSKQNSSGIICSNTDLISILSSLTSSASEINQCGVNRSEMITTDQKRGRLKTNRSNSFDVSVLHGTGNKILHLDSKQPPPGPSDWFVKRHQPMSTKTIEDAHQNIPKVTFTLDTDQAKDKVKKKEKPNSVVWDGRSGSVVDAQLLGNAIEDFLRRDSNDPSANVSPMISPSKSTSSKTNPKPARPKTNWFSAKAGESSSETCESSICSTLKDLFIK